MTVPTAKGAPPDRSGSVSRLTNDPTGIERFGCLATAPEVARVAAAEDVGSGYSLALCVGYTGVGDQGVADGC